MSVKAQPKRVAAVCKTGREALDASTFGRRRSAWSENVFRRRTKRRVGQSWPLVTTDGVLDVEIRRQRAKELTAEPRKTPPCADLLSG